jgi:hypothetical protein
MGQAERTRAVAGKFSGSWSLMLGSPGWWPARPQVECARLLREADRRADATASAEFVSALGSSLRKWRAFRGVPFDGDRLKASLRAVAPLLDRWEDVSILTLRSDDIEDLFRLFDAVREVKPTRRKWVATSKMLHHLLPDLIVPMDNLMTAPFLGRGSLSDAFEASFIVESYSAFVDLAKNRSYGIGTRRVRAAAREVPYPIEGALPDDCRIGVARVVDFAIAGFLQGSGRAGLKAL